MSSFAEFCIFPLSMVVTSEIYASIYDLSLEKSLPTGVIGRIASVGVPLTLIEYLFFKYLKKVVYKKQFPFNVDFIGVWLEITNFVIAVCLAFFMTYEADYVKYYGNPFLANLWPYYHSIR